MINMSTSLMLGVGGILALMVGTNETKASTRTATVPSLLDNSFSWKKVNKQMTQSIQIGMKTVRIVDVGNWYIDILK